MFKNVWYDKKMSEMHMWFELDGENLYTKSDWVPYVYMETDKKTPIKSIYNKNVTKKKFKSFKEYNIFQNNPKNFEKINENKSIPEIQYLAEITHDTEDENIHIPKLKIFSIDVEVYTDGVFPNPEDAEYPVVVISVYDNNGKCVVFGEKSINDIPEDVKDNVKFVDCKNEKKLLSIFMQYIHKENPDVITGWNIVPNVQLNMSGFDISYLVNRCIRLFGENTNIYKKLSPINIVNKWHDKLGNIVVDVAGVSLLDYNAIYKWFTRKNLESYTLDFVSKTELEEGKVDYSEYESLNELYKKDWDKYVYYNIIDAKRVIQLEENLEYIKLVQTMSLLTRTPMKFWQTTTALIEGRMLTFYRRNKLCAPRFVGGQQFDFPAAYVKEPQKGLHKWIVSVDIASSYPTAIITLNMSLETYVGQIQGFSEEEIIEYTSKRKFPSFEIYDFNKDEKKIIKNKSLDVFNKMLEKGLICISPCGTIFKNIPTGVIAKEEKDMFFKRREIKKKMREIDDKNEREKLNVLQNAMKIFLNGFFGVTSVPYSRYFNLHIAESITACGRHAIKQGEKFCNELLNDPTEEVKEVLNNLRG